MRESSRWDKQDVEKTILDLLVEKYGDTVACTVDAEPGTDYEGDDIIQVMIVVEPFSAVLKDPPVDVLSRLRRALIDRDIEDFPIISYLSKKDADRRKRAAA